MQIQRINNQQSQKSKPAFGTTFNVSPEAKTAIPKLIDALAEGFVDLSNKEADMLQNKTFMNATLLNSIKSLRVKQANIKKSIIELGKITNKLSSDVEKHNNHEAKKIFKPTSINDATLKSIELVGFKNTKKGGELVSLSTDNIVNEVTSGVNKFGLMIKSTSQSNLGNAHLTLAVNTEKTGRNRLVYKDAYADPEPAAIKGNIATYIQSVFESAHF